MNAAARHLCIVEPGFAPLIRRVGPCPRPKSSDEPYQALIRSVAYQQLHARAAETILGRFLALFPGQAFPTPEQVLSTGDAAMRGSGFSGSKTAAIRDIALHATIGVVPTRRAASRLTDAALIERLTVIRGVGRWTVEMLLMSTLARPDVLPVDDFGVREGYRLLHGLEAQPRPRDLVAIGEAWAPFRSTAAWYLWRRADEGKVKPASRLPGETP
jgi:DNA-3-methyladenine glycosylase II